MLSFFDDFDELEKGNDKPFSNVKENEKENEKESVDNTDIIKDLTEVKKSIEDLTEVKKSIEDLTNIVNTFGDLIKELKNGTGTNDN